MMAKPNGADASNGPLDRLTTFLEHIRVQDLNTTHVLLSTAD